MLTIEKMGKPSPPWKLMLYPAHLALEPPHDTAPFLLLREQVMNTATLIEGMRALVLSEPFKATFKLTRESAATLAEWIGSPVLAAYYLRRRYGWVLPVAAIWVIGSLPLSGDSSTGVEALPFDPIGLVLGLALVAGWACAKWRPHAALFLVDSIWFLVMASHLAMDVARGRSKAWLVLVTLLLWMAVTGVKHFIRFRGTCLVRAKS